MWLGWSPGGDRDQAGAGMSQYGTGEVGWAEPGIQTGRWAESTWIWGGTRVGMQIEIKRPVDRVSGGKQCWSCVRSRWTAGGLGWDVQGEERQRRAGKVEGREQQGGGTASGADPLPPGTPSC